MSADSLTPVPVPVAVIWNTYVPAGVPLIFRPEHPLSPLASPASSSSIIRPASLLRFLPRPLHSSSPSSSPPGRMHIAAADLPSCRSSFACDPAVSGEPVSTTTVIVCVPPAPSVTESLLKVQVAAYGSPRHPRLSVSLKLFTEASVSVTVLCCCDCSVTADGLICMLNCVGGVTVMLVCAEVDPAYTESPE